MQLHILRHGKAVEREEWDGDDAERPLTPDGMALTERLAKRLAPLVTASGILTSPWMRARQTAEIAARAWRLPLRQASWLAGGAATAQTITTRLASRADDVVLVGHEPDLGLLVAHLTGGGIVLKKGGFAVLEGRPEAGGMALWALIPPRLIKERD